MTSNTDLPTRLREAVDNFDDRVYRLAEKAADLIEQQQATIAELQARLTSSQLQCKDALERLETAQARVERLTERNP